MATSSPSPKSPGQISDKSKKYDRQLRYDITESHVFSPDLGVLMHYIQM